MRHSEVTESLFVHEQAHHLWNCDDWVRVIQLYNLIVREFLEILAVVAYEVVHKVLKTCGREEILLLKAKCFSRRTVVVRVEDAAYILGGVLFFNGAKVFHLVEKLKVKAVLT